jgi:hypothetical protein
MIDAACKLFNEERSFELKTSATWEFLLQRTVPFASRQPRWERIPCVLG